MKKSYIWSLPTRVFHLLFALFILIAFLTDDDKLLKFHAIAGYSILILLVVFFVDENLILSKMPTCEYQKIGKECFLCGSTRAFIEIKNMNFDKAWSLNKLSFLIFGALAINTILFLKTIIKKYTNTKL